MPQLRGLPADPVDVRLSKTLAYLLRHGAEKHDLPMRADGYVRVVDLLEDPMLANGVLTIEKLQELVKDNSKQRFVLIRARDETPVQHRPRKQTGQGKLGGKGKRNASVEMASEGQTSTASTSTLPPNPQHQLPLILYDPDPISAIDPLTTASSQPEYYIRAAQGHSLPTLQAEAMLTPIDLADPKQLELVGEMVHGTKWEKWEAILSTGLSRMTRNHIHLSTSSTHPSCRPNSTLLIYLSSAALRAHRPEPIAVYTSTNGVVLTPGDEEGKVGREMWETVIRVRRERVVEPVQVAGESSETGTGAADRSNPISHAEETVARVDVATVEADRAIKAAARKAAKDRKRGASAKVNISAGGEVSGWKLWKEVIWEGGEGVDPPRALLDGQ